MKIGTQKWIDYWVNAYWKRALGFSRLKYPMDEQLMYESLFLMCEWKDREPWAI